MYKHVNTIRGFRASISMYTLQGLNEMDNGSLIIWNLLLIKQKHTSSPGTLKFGPQMNTGLKYSVKSRGLPRGKSNKQNPENQ